MFVKFLLVEAMRTLDLPVPLRCSSLDVSVADALVLNRPVKLGMEPVAFVCPDFPDAERELGFATHSKSSAQAVVKDIRRATRKQSGGEESIWIVLAGLRVEDSIAELCSREGIASGVYYKWSKDFMETCKRLLAVDTSRAAYTDKVRNLRRNARDPKEVVAE